MPDQPAKGPLAQKILYEQAKGLLRSGKPEEAVALFRQAIDAQVGGKLLPSCYLGLGSALSEAGRRSEAVKAYRKVVDLLPDDPEAHRALAMGLEDAGELSEAASSLETALRLDPDDLTGYQDLAGLHLKRKDLPQARFAYEAYERRRAELVLLLLREGTTEQRIEAAEALGPARDEATVKALGLALSDADRGVRLAVIRALGLQGLVAGAGPLKAHLLRSPDAEEKQAIGLSLRAIERAPQPEAEPLPAFAPDAGPGGALPGPPHPAALDRGAPSPPARTPPSRHP